MIMMKSFTVLVLDSTVVGATIRLRGGIKQFISDVGIAITYNALSPKIQLFVSAA
jgi:hypothetical protein